jgi:general secretion pathway protein D
METLKPTTISRGRAAFVASACLIAPLVADEPPQGNQLSAPKSSSSKVSAQEARELLRKGDEFYNSSRFADAVEAYAGARDLIPSSATTLRAAATERYAQAAVEHARVLSRKGDITAAKAAVEKVLDPSFAPKNPGALAFLAQLNDPIRTNPALTAEHAADVDQVRRTLYVAEAAFNLGKLDEAISQYEAVVRIDPTNTAARRGLEQVAMAKSQAAKAGYDHTKAEMLAEVAASWETQAPSISEAPALGDLGGNSDTSNSISLKDKIDRIIIPKIALDQASLSEALEFLSLRAREFDTLETDPDRKGVNFAINLGSPESPTATRIRDARFDLQISQVPLSQALRYITDITKTAYTTDDFSVIITPTGADSVELVTRTYRVPPDFISSMSNGPKEEAAADPFGEAPASGGLLAKRLGAQEALATQGVSFPEGASANYTPSTNTLRVINTPLNQDYISQIVETLTKTEPVMVAVRVTMMRVEQNRLEELGYDWLLDNYGFGGPSWVPGAAKYTLTGGTAGNGSDLGDIELPANASTRNPITGGNRSGDSAIDSNSLDNLINDQRGRQASDRAPGVLGVNGIFSDTTVQSLMRGLNQKKGVDMLAKPAVITRSGQASSISMVREFIYATEYEPPELPNSTGITSGNITPVTPATPTAFETKDVGITMEVLPVVDENKQYVSVTLSPTFSDFDGFVNYGSPINTTVDGLLGPETATVTDNTILMPVFSKQSLSSTIDVADGSTVVIGGLMQDRVQNVEDKTPILGSLPILGRLFQSKASQSTSTAIIFFVNVELMDPTGRPYRER